MGTYQRKSLMGGSEEVGTNKSNNNEVHATGHEKPFFMVRG